MKQWKEIQESLIVREQEKDMEGVLSYGDQDWGNMLNGITQRTTRYKICCKRNAGNKG